MERNPRSNAERRSTVELDVGLRGRRPAGIQGDPLGVQTVDDVAGNGQVPKRRSWVEWAGFWWQRRLGRRCLGRQLPSHRGNAFRRLDRDFASSLLLCPASERPAQGVAPGCATREPQPRRLEEVRQPREIDRSYATSQVAIVGTPRPNGAIR